ncbi:hypothetical protein GDO86_004804 [Hymenochirus boettgeri]|uniref:RAB6-interacting golgin n=1 Tax=Hymenochirus boettgeri TaxID=247094 RepID=A0A8T2KES0_9PIPI|nr:hypothetical protein GDO86_004804 [Hymenochirus boettgeri]
MAGWAGFSEEELRSLKMRQEFPNSVERPRRQAPVAKNRQQVQRRAALQLQNEQFGLPVPTEQQLSKPKVTMSPKVTPNITEEKLVPVNNTNNANITPPVGPAIKVNEPEPEPDGRLNRKEMELKEKSRIDQLQLEQRLMEEKNKRKKALLSKAIAERSKKTQAETVKLKRIQTQLQALDDLVSTDIGILRNRIDQACLEFSQAKKRYDKAEAEYIVAKLDLHKKTELKEQLTEHLCTIIQQNEARKAKKLEELMQQLEVEADEEKMELEIEVEQMLQHQEAEAKRQQVTSPEKDKEPEVKEPCADQEGDQEGLAPSTGQDKDTQQRTS